MIGVFFSQLWFYALLTRLIIATGLDTVKRRVVNHRQRAQAVSRLKGVATFEIAGLEACFKPFYPLPGGAMGE